MYSILEITESDRNNKQSDRKNRRKFYVFHIKNYNNNNNNGIVNHTTHADQCMTDGTGVTGFLDEMLKKVFAAFHVLYTILSDSFTSNGY